MGLIATSTSRLLPTVGLRPIADLGSFGDAAPMRKLVAALSLSIAACSEQVEESYSTWAEADRSGAVARGWIPPFIPTNARDIRDSHDLDSNRQTLRFVARLVDVAVMIDGLPSVSTENKAAVSSLANKHGLPLASDAYVVCAEPLDGTLLVDRDTGRAVYTTDIEWADEECARSQRKAPPQLSAFRP